MIVGSGVCRVWLVVPGCIGKLVAVCRMGLGVPCCVGKRVADFGLVGVVVDIVRLPCLPARSDRSGCRFIAGSTGVVNSASCCC